MIKNYKIEAAQVIEEMQKMSDVEVMGVINETLRQMEKHIAVQKIKTPFEKKITYLDILMKLLWTTVDKTEKFDEKTEPVARCIRLSLWDALKIYKQQKRKNVN